MTDRADGNSAESLPHSHDNRLPLWHTFAGCGGLLPDEDGPTAVTLVIAADDMPFSALRAVLPPAVTRGSAPLVVHAARLPYLARYFPVTTWRAGRDWQPPAVWPAVPAPPERAWRADVATRAVWASGVLWEPAETDRHAALAARLRCLVDELGGPPHATAAAAWRWLANAGTDPAADPSPMIDPAAPVALPGLRAVLAELDTALLVVTPQALDAPAAAWAAAGAALRPTYRKLAVATTAQLALLTHETMALSFGIGRFSVVWGADVLGGPPPLAVAVREMLRHLLAVEMQALPAAYWRHHATAPRRVLHDLGNELLKAQLRYDLLCMSYGVRRRPTPALSSSGRLLDDRIADLRRCLDAWLALSLDLAGEAAP